MSFRKGFEKEAKKEERSNHHVRRALLGGPVATAIAAKKGKKLKAFGEAYGHQTAEMLKGTAAGGLLGLAGGALGGAALAARKGKGADFMKALKAGTLIGGVGGASVGNIAGKLKGVHGEEATRIYNKYRKKD